MPHCEHFILAPSASQLPQRPTALPLPSLVLPCALSLLFALPAPFLRGVPSAPPRSSGWGRWKTVGSYEAVVEEDWEPSGSGSGSSAAPLLSLLRVDAVCWWAIVLWRSVGSVGTFLPYNDRGRVSEHWRQV